MIGTILSEPTHQVLDRSVLAARAPSHHARAPKALEQWLRAQSTNLSRHAAALRPFRVGEFGSDAASPSEAHRQAANRLLEGLRRNLVATGRGLTQRRRAAVRSPGFDNLRAFTRGKDAGSRAVKATEQVWRFYYALFNQRQSPLAPLLLAADRIGLDCYQAVYTGLGQARSIPSPPPFAFLETKNAPATFRRGVMMTRLERRPNPFPLIRLPYHRLINPWTLGAIPHEVAHNLQSDLGLWRLLPQEIAERLRREGIEERVAAVWARWHKEIFADLCGLLLTGPTFVVSLMSVVGRSPRRTVAFNPLALHPVPYLRVFINLELLRRMGFRRQAAELGQAWNRLYPPHLRSRLPSRLVRSFGQAHRLVVDTLCYSAYSQLGGKCLAGVVSFGAKEQKMTEEAARRLAAGNDPGILPERFLIGAVRLALERRLARPGILTRNFYNALGRR